VEQEERALGALAGEADGPAQADAQALWRGVQDRAAAWPLVPLGRRSVHPTRRTAQALGRDTQHEQRLHDVGSEAADEAWREAVRRWAEEQGARALREVGWEAMQEAWEAGHDGLAAEGQRQRLRAQVQAWPRLEDALQDLARHLDALSAERGGSGPVRLRLWEREQGLGL
jgi:hypothetical protein